MLAPFSRSPDRAAAASRLKAWTRARFSLSSDATILVTELESALPGFPPLQTVVSFWSPERRHYHWRIFRPLEEVTEDDVPPAWYREALEVTAGLQCGCC
jgi:nitrate reductase delta subunit